MERLSFLTASDQLAQTIVQKQIQAFPDDHQYTMIQNSLIWPRASIHTYTILLLQVESPESDRSSYLNFFIYSFPLDLVIVLEKNGRALSIKQRSRGRSLLQQLETLFIVLFNFFIVQIMLVWLRQEKTIFSLQFQTASSSKGRVGQCSRPITSTSSFRIPSKKQSGGHLSQTTEYYAMLPTLKTKASSHFIIYETFQNLLQRHTLTAFASEYNNSFNNNFSNQMFSFVNSQRPRGLHTLLDMKKN